MGAKRFAPIAICLALFLLALPASARNHDRDDRRDAAHDRVVGLADRLDDATAELYRSVASTRRGLFGVPALRAAQQLDREARELHAQVARYGVFDRGTQRELDQVREALRVAERRVTVFRRDPVRRDLARVEGLVQQLERGIQQSYAERREPRVAVRGPVRRPAFLTRR